MLVKANRQAGRGRRNRKKTVSDMTEMLASPPSSDQTPDTRNSISLINIIPKKKPVATSCPPSPALRQESDTSLPSVPYMKAINIPIPDTDLSNMQKTSSDNDLKRRAARTPPSPAPRMTSISASPSWPPPPPL